MDKFELSPSAFAARLQRDRNEHLFGTIRHAYGNCGGYAGLCGACYKDEYAEMLIWAAKQPRPNEGEDIGDYWHRVGGRFLDCWYEVASAQFRSIGLEHAR